MSKIGSVDVDIYSSDKPIDIHAVKTTPMIFVKERSPSIGDNVLMFAYIKHKLIDSKCSTTYLCDGDHYDGIIPLLLSYRYIDYVIKINDEKLKRGLAHSHTHPKLIQWLQTSFQFRDFLYHNAYQAIVPIDNYAQGSTEDFDFLHRSEKCITPYACIQPASTTHVGQAKYWKSHGFIIDYIEDTWGIPVYIIGSKDDNRTHIMSTPRLGKNLSGQLTLKQSACLVAQSRLALSTCSWSGHFAAWMGVPCLFLFDMAIHSFNRFQEHFSGKKSLTLQEAGQNPEIIIDYLETAYDLPNILKVF